MSSFMELALKSDVLLDEIDDFVDAWHEGAGDSSLAEFLGMTSDEYALWATSPALLSHIVTARMGKRLLSEVVNDNFDELRMAARADPGAERKLKLWLSRRNDA